MRFANFSTIPIATTPCVQESSCFFTRYPPGLHWNRPTLAFIRPLYCPLEEGGRPPIQPGMTDREMGFWHRSPRVTGWIILYTFSLIGSRENGMITKSDADAYPNTMHSHGREALTAFEQGRLFCETQVNYPALQGGASRLLLYHHHRRRVCHLERPALHSAPRKPSNMPSRFRAWVKPSSFVSPGPYGMTRRSWLPSATARRPGRTHREDNPSALTIATAGTAPGDRGFLSSRGNWRDNSR